MNTTTIPRERKVTRVLVMLEYGPEDPDSGEVFDLTALASELAMRAETHYQKAEIKLSVEAGPDYASALRPIPQKLEVSWGTYINCHFSPKTARLEDAINMGLPDGERVKSFRAKAKKLRKRADDLDYDAQVAKLEQVAQVRHLHPIARVTDARPALESAGARTEGGAA